MVEGIYKINSNKKSLRNNNQFTIREENKELQIYVGGEEEKALHEEVFIENTEDNFETHATLEMKQRASTDGCLNYEGVPTSGCSQLYVGDIEINLKVFLQSKLSKNMKIKTL